jgi:16S rRNA (adenine1518-N6/adenine1519-N6)-dimethyltransferase
VADSADEQREAAARAPDPGWDRVHPRDVLRRAGLAARRRHGQNFLLSPAMLDRVVEAAQLRPQDVVLEVGTGLGRLAARLAARAARVVTVEIDAGLFAIASANLSHLPNVELLHADVLESKHRLNPAVTQAVRSVSPPATAELRVVSNLPYSAASPCLVALLEWELEPQDLCLMLQQEVARRTLASPGTPDYGPLTVFVNHWSEAEMLLTVGPGEFWPVPRVFSALVRFRRRPHRMTTSPYPVFAETVRRLFTQRRKTLRKAARTVWGPRAADALLGLAGVDPGLRVDRLTAEHFGRLAAASLHAAPPQ